MNCLEFEKIVVDLARGEGLEPSLQRQANQHAQACVRCAGRWQTEKSLNRSLRAVRTGDEASLRAPVAVENALLAAFRAQHDPAPLPSVVTAPTVVESSFRQFFSQLRWILIPAAAVAAIVLIVVAVARLKPSTTPTPDVLVREISAPVPNESVAPAPERGVIPVPQIEDVPQQIAIRAPVRRMATPVKANPNPSLRQRGGRVSVDVGPFELDEPEAISAQEFLVFDYAKTLPPADSTQLMRVRMPREQLAPLGIPLPRGTRNENFVNADFLVGSDGVPRAIRVANR